MGKRSGRAGKVNRTGGERMYEDDNVIDDGITVFVLIRSRLMQARCSISVSTVRSGSESDSFDWRTLGPSSPDEM